MRQRPSGGFTYLGLVMLLAVLGLVAAAGLKMGTLMQRAAAEEELLEIGAQFSEALRSYAAATPQGQPQHPPSLKELLKDPRFPNPRRHLRKIFVDPVTGKAEWGIVYLGEKVGVVGVYSLSSARPLKIANFDIRFQGMENRQRISDWKFLMAGGDGVPPAVLTPPNAMTAAPSLFAPATPSGPGAPPQMDGRPVAGQPPAAGEPKPGQAPPEPAEVVDTIATMDGIDPAAAKDEPDVPVDAPAGDAKDDKDAEPVPETDDGATPKPADPSAIVQPPPVIEPRR